MTLPLLVVTGASGFVGRHLLELLAPDYRIVGIARRSQVRSGALVHPNLTWHQADVADRDALRPVFEELRGEPVHALLHLAAHYDFTGEEDPEYWRTNVVGTRIVLDLSKELQLGRARARAGAQGDRGHRYPVGRGGRVHGRRLHAQHEAGERQRGRDTAHPAEGPRGEPRARLPDRCGLTRTEGRGARRYRGTARGRLRGRHRRRPADRHGHPGASRSRVHEHVRHAGHRALRGSVAQGEGVAHEGPVASSLGLKGIPGAAEAITAGRDILLAEMTGGHVHIANMSAWTTLEAVRQGKSRGVRVTAAVCPHHFTLTDDMLAAPTPYDANTKMNPPLREARDRDAMLAGIADGSVDVIATDHAPHLYDEKNVQFDRAPFGIVGLETAIPICLDRLMRGGVIRLPRLVEMMSVNPARILKVPGGSLAPGALADLTVLAPDLVVTIDRAEPYFWPESPTP